ncbi:ABC transporter permease [Angustibacter sp. Root456]|uniref:ABC transporter permease n=1 Tax=Angustibacter sp. Root456 TaxID=1736539 RepID=UPI0006F85F56|nr:ABC transporter permease [Angustibacter sp. Root456]KQX69712.1 hypothetical protein ASD06_01320 [Angustibacter sp. Root456]
MARALQAELVKIRTTRMWWGLLLGLVVLVALQVTVTAAFSGRSPGAGQPALPGLDSAEGLRTALSSGFQSGYLMALVLGTIIGAVDFRHRTATQTFLATPHRSRVIAAKVLSGVAYGLLYAVVTQALSLALVALVSTIRGGGLGAADATVVRALLLGLPGIALWCVIGVSLGMLLRNQIAAVLVAVGFVFLIDPLLGLALNQLDLQTLGEYTVSNASTALVQGYTGSDLLPWWAGGLVMVAYGLVIAVAAWLTSARRDIT